MAKFADFERYVLPWISNVPVPAMHDALRDAAIEFCERTRVRTQILTGIPTVAGEPQIPLDLADCELEVSEAIEVWSTTGWMTPKTELELSSLFPKGWRNEVRDNMNQIPYWISTTHCSIRIVPAASVSIDNALSVRVALKPTRASKTLPDVLYRHYAQDIGHGALALLHSHKDVGYADSKRVPPHRSAFELAMNRAADNYAHGFNKPRLRTGQDEFT